MFFEYPGDAHKFIHCDVWGHAWTTMCPVGELWGQDLETCYVPAAYSPCLNHQDGDPYIYPHSCDPTKFIHCDTNHQSFVQDCQDGFKFLPSSSTCVPSGDYGTDALVNTCNGATAPPRAATTLPPRTTIRHTTQPPVTYTYATDGSIVTYEFDGDNTYVAPCNAANIAADELYFAYKHDNQHYIQCDLTGHQYLQSCDPNYYDPYTHTCVDGPVFVDNIVGRK